MADTKRTLAATIALFPNNTTGDIDPQDARDFIVSVYAPRFNVQNYGAVGDGTTDDAAAFNACIAAALAAKGAVYVPTPSVSYMIKSQLTLDDVGTDGLAIIGDGYNSLIDFLPSTLTQSLFYLGEPTLKGCLLNGGCTSSDMTMAYDGDFGGGALPIGGGKIRIGNEIIQYSGTAAGFIVVATGGRGVDGSTAALHADNAPVYHFPVVEGITIQGLRLRSQAQVTGAAIFMANLTQSVIKDVWITCGGTPQVKTKTFRYGLFVDGGWQDIIQNVCIEGLEETNGVGVYQTLNSDLVMLHTWGIHVFDVLMDNRLFGWTPKAGFMLTNADDWRVESCNVFGMNVGLWLEASLACSNQNWINCNFESTPTVYGAGFIYVPSTSLGGIGNISFQNCWWLALGANLPGLYIFNDHATTYLSVLRFENCWFAGGIGGTGGDDVKIVKTNAAAALADLNFYDCYCTLGTGDGFDIDEKIGNIKIIGCSILNHSAASQYGIRISAGSSVLSYQIEDNYFSGNTLDFLDGNTGTGDKILTGNVPKSINRVKHTEYWDVFRMQPITGAVLAAIGTFFAIRNFVNTADNEADCYFRAPPNLIGQQRFYIDWAPNDTDTGSCTWSILRRELTPETSLLDTTIGTNMTMADAGGGTANKLQRTAATAWVSAVVADNDLRLRIYRTVSDAYNGTAQLFMVSMEYYTTE
jgi:hypothetical protein